MGTLPAIGNSEICIDLFSIMVDLQLLTAEVTVSPTTEEEAQHYINKKSRTCIYLSFIIRASHKATVSCREAGDHYTRWDLGTQ